MNLKTSINWSFMILLFLILVFSVNLNVLAQSAETPNHFSETFELTSSTTLTFTHTVTDDNIIKSTPIASPTGNLVTPVDHTPNRMITSTPTLSSDYGTATPPPSSTPTARFTSTTTLEPTVTFTQVITITPTPSLMITPTATLDFEELSKNSELVLRQIYIPFLSVQEPQPYIPPELALFCSSPNQSIPDNDPEGSSNTIQISDPRLISDLNIYLNVDHTYVGDLTASLTHQESGKKITLFDKPGYPGDPCSKDDIRAIFDDEMSWHVETKCASYPAAISGSFESDKPLSTFDGLSINGEWIINISDSAPNDNGTLKAWCLAAQISKNPAPPTPEPPSPELPLQKIIYGVSGKPQSLPLDCESRSAVDWAKYFGKNIDELSFFHKLPHSDNPDKGFVGPVTGTWGQIPPKPYGVHAEPVAQVLRDYGLPAKARRPLSWDELRAEIAAGRPVIVWIIGSISLPGSLMNGAPEYYTSEDGLHTVVSRYEHTVVVTGYTSSYVYYLNGGQIYQINSDKFLDSWSALGNMAITWTP